MNILATYEATFGS